MLFLLLYMEMLYTTNYFLINEIMSHINFNFYEFNMQV